jgi:pimeloyl-ACP methyl ester carboxylesterase
MTVTRREVPLVMLPGSMCDRRLFAHQVDALGPSVTVGDLGCGASIEAMADNVLSSAPDQFALAGLSLGGIVAAEIAVRAPERLLGLAVIDTNLGLPDGEQLARRAAWARRTRVGEFADLVAKELVHPMTRFPETHGTLIFDMAFQLGAATFLQQNEALLHRRDRRDDLASLTVPILVAVGRDDGLCPPDLHHNLVTRTPGADLVVVDDAGHLATVDQPDALSSVLGSWLSTCTDTTTTYMGRNQ